jgi:thioesterase domain-containing protein
VHGGIGFTLYNRQFLDGFDKAQPVGFIEAIGFDGKEPPLESVEAMAARYLQAIQQVFPNGGWRIAGNCAGGLVALEMCRQAAAAGTPADRLLLIDPKPDLFRSPEQKQHLNQESDRRSGRKLLLRRIRKILFRRGDDAELFMAELNHRKDRQSRIENRLQKLADGERGAMISAGASYNASAVRRVSGLFSQAVDRYAAPVWTGTVYLLQTEGRHRYRKVMAGCLPHAVTRPVPYTHRTLFIEGLSCIQKFLNDAISPDDRETFS